MLACIRMRCSSVKRFFFYPLYIGVNLLSGSWRAFCFGFVLYFLVLPAFAYDMRFQRILSTEGHQPELMGVGTIDIIRQDRLGFMWFGGENALLRYDGATFKRYEVSGADGAIPTSAIRDIVIDHANKMWIATDIGLILYSDQQDQFSIFRGLSYQPESLPSPSVTALAVDKRNHLIIGTDNGVTILDRNRRIFIPLPFGDNAEPGKREVMTLFIDSKNRLWVGTRGSGLFLFSVERELVRHYVADALDPTTLRSNTVSSLAEDRLGRIWAGTLGGGVSRMNEGERTVINYHHRAEDKTSLASDIVTQVYLDSNDDIWVATEQGGLARYLPGLDHFTHYQHSAYDRFSLPTNQVKALAEDNEGNLWVATFPGGVSFYDRTHASVRNFIHREDDDASLSHSGVLSFFKANNGGLWVGTEAGLNHFNLDTQKVDQKYLVDADDPMSLQANAVLSLAEDKGMLWVGTWAGGLQKMDLNKRSSTNYRFDTDDPNSLPSDFVWSLLIDSEDTLWVGLEKGGLAKYRPKTDDFQRYTYDPGNPDGLAGDFVQTILEDSRNQLWLGTTGGLNILDRKTDEFTHFRYNSKIAGVRVTALMEDSQGSIWVGTQEDGIFLYDHETKSFSAILVPRVEITRISSFVEDNQRFVWAGTTTGVLRINPNTRNIQTYSKHHGLSSTNYNRNSVFKDIKGNLYFGGTEGFSIFDPRELVKPPDNYSVVLTDFKIFNRSVEIDSQDSPLSKSITFTDHIALEYDQNVFSFLFSALDYRSMGKNKYAYTMEGFDSDWYFSESNNSATYTNLSPGEYTFKVKGADRDENWSQYIAEIKVDVRPSVWRAWWAYLIYITLFALACRSLIAAYRHRFEIKNQDVLSAEIKNINDAKDAFIKNTSYEFYQPVRDIVRMGEAALTENKDKLPYNAVQKIRSIVDRGNSLASVIYEIQDFGKLDDADMEPNFSAVNLKALVQGIFDEHGSLGRQNNIHLVNAIDDITPKILADPAYLNQALSILVASAMQDLKDGVVTVRAIVLVEKVQIEVEDTGSGLAQETYQALFGSSDNAVRSGAGVIAQLSQVKHLIDLQNSQLVCRSRWAEGDVKSSFGLNAGTCFSFVLPWAEDEVSTETGDTFDFQVSDIHESKSEAKDELEQKNAADIKLGEFSLGLVDREKTDSAEPTVSTKKASASDVQKTILIVDDDPINRMVLSGMLGLQDYNLIEVSSGPEALDLILEQKKRVDLVLLDVMMPRMTGFEVCSRLREVFDQKVLPVVFLTAKHEEQDLETARESGGNDVLHKPVKKDSLLEHVNQYLIDSASPKSGCE